MSDIAISVDKLGKCYRLQHESRRPKTAVEALRGAVSSPFRYLADKIRRPDESELFWALRDVSFEVKRGEVLGIIGRNGAGKSTLLKILSRITDPTNGRAVIAGRVNSLLEVGTGFHPELSGRENIFMNAAMHGMKRSEILAKLDEIVAFSEVEKFIDTPVKRDSSGMYTRLAFAVAAHLEPEILIVDEVLSVGDASFQQKCMGKMSHVASHGRTVLFVSHNMGAVSQLCKTCVWLDGGTVRQAGETSAVLSSYMASCSSVTDSGEATFAEDPAKPAQLLKIRLLDPAGRVTAAHNCDDPIVVEMTLVVRKTVPGMFCWLDFSRPDGTYVLMTDSFDTPPNPLDNLAPGLHRINVTIPRRTIGHGEYTVALAFTGFLGGRTPVDNPDVVCKLTINDFTSKRGNQRPGFLSVQPPWDVTRIS